MTRSAVQGWINQATRALAANRCDLAGEYIQSGYQALQDYAGALAAAGASPAPTIRLHNALAKLHARRQRVCVTDSLIAPSFQGPLMERADFMPVLGFVLAVTGLVIGFGSVYKNG